MFTALRKNIMGQTIVEYSLLIGIVIALLLVVTPMIKRGAQGMIKTVSDEIGYQNDAEQKEGPGLMATRVETTLDKQQRKREFYNGTKHSAQTDYAETSTTRTQSQSDLGPVE